MTTILVDPVGTARKRFNQALRLMLERTVRILMNDSHVSVTFSDSQTQIAHSVVSQKTIVISPSSLRRGRSIPTRLATVRLSLGLLYHEAGHLLWTPGYFEISSLLRAVIDRTGKTAAGYWNQLEDKRIENLFVKRYPPAKAYIAEPLGAYILKELDDQDRHSVRNVWLGLVGRPWLGHDHYQQARDLTLKHLGASFVESTERVTRDYIRLSASDYSDTKRVADLICEWIRLYADDTPTGTCSDTSNSSPLARRQSDPSDDSLSDEDAEDVMSGGTDDGDGEASDSDSTDGDAEGSPSDGKSDDTDSDSDSSGSAAGDDESTDESAEPGTGATKGATTTPQTLKEATKDAVAKAIEDQMDEATELLKQATKIAAQQDPEPTSTVSPLWHVSTQPVTQTMRVISRQVAQQLVEVRNEASPEWLHGTDVGRVNIAREMQFGDTERLDVFDLYDVGTEDDMRCHVTLCIDQSESMCHPASSEYEIPYLSAANTAWILQEAFAKVDHEVDVYGYSERYQKLTEKHSPSTVSVKRPSGGTDPLPMLQNVLRTSMKRTDISDHLLVVLTDGSWGMGSKRDAEPYEKLLSEWRRLGGHALLFMIRSNEYNLFTGAMTRGFIDEKEPYGFESWTVVNDPMEMLAPISSFVKQLMRSHLNR